MPIYAPGKGILCPPFGHVDVTPYLPLLSTPEVQRLKYRTQLSLVREVYPAATHTRLFHSLGVMRLTNRILDSMFLRGFFAEEDKDALRRDLNIAALVHDIGHPPFSHATEYVLCQLGSIKNHKERTVDIISGPLAEKIRECGSTPERIVDLLDKKKGDPRGAIVTSKSIGADKIAYLFQDQHQTGYNAAMPRDWNELVPYMCFAHDRLCVEEKKEQLLKNMQRFYFEMWTRVYLRKQAVAFGRVLQKAIELHVSKTGLDADVVWGRSEGWLEDTLAQSPIETVARLYGRVMSRQGLKAAVSFKIDEYKRSERKANKPIAVVGAEKEALRAFLIWYENPLRLTELEGRIAKELGLADHDVVVSIVPEPAKLVPEDVLLVDTSGERAGTLFERSPDFHKSLQESADEFLAIRVMVDESERQRVSEASDTIADVVKSHSNINL